MLVNIFKQCVKILLHKIILRTIYILIELSIFQTVVLMLFIKCLNVRYIILMNKKLYLFQKNFTQHKTINVLNRIEENYFFCS